MQSLSQLYLPGAVALWSAVVFALAALWGYSLVLRGEEGARPFARRAYAFYALAVTLASAVLVVALARRDFRIEYVAQYSGLDLAGHFQIAAFWAGQKGSFLIWLLWGTLLGLPLARAAGKRAEAPVMGLYTLTLMGLLFILVRENPFVMLAETPLDGQGLNPLLQDDWMVIHPPIMFVGYALGAVPFAFAMAALWRRQYDSWAARAFPWVLFGFLVLGAAILMGGYWAYKTLGWGGYWGWDPVENASLIPWLLMVALLHGLYLERTKGRFRRSNYMLAALIYLSVLYGTFLTRSGVLADFSVHSFVDLGISGWLIALMVVFLTVPVVLMALRLKEVPSVPSEDPPLSRGFFMVLSVLTVLVSAVAVTVGTSAPLLTRFMEDPGQVGPEWYNTVHLPLAILVALLLSLVPFLTWKGNGAPEVFKKAAIGAGLGLALTAALVVGLKVDDTFHMVLLFLAATAIFTNLQKTFARAQSRGLAGTGGWLAHAGVGIMLIGFISSSAYDESSKVTLVQGEPQAVGDVTLTFNRFIPRQNGQKERLEVKVARADGEEFLAYPKLFVNDRTRQMMANPDIKKSIFQDLYLSPIEYDPGRPAGAPERIQLAKGESYDLGGVRLTFDGFDLEAGGRNALAAMESGGSMVIGADLRVERDGEAAAPVQALYSFTQGGMADSQPVRVPGGGALRISGINAADGKVQLDLAGIGERSLHGEPAKLSLDMTRKPLINLVWYGLYVVLAGGAISMFQRFRQARELERAAG